MSFFTEMFNVLIKLSTYFAAPSLSASKYAHAHPKWGRAFPPRGGWGGGRAKRSGGREEKEDLGPS